MSGLHDALGQLRLDGALFLRSRFTEPWAYESVSGEIAAGLLGVPQVVIFHVVAEGRCWVKVGDGEEIWADTGDVIVMPYGANHRVGGAEPAEPITLADLIPLPPWTSVPNIEFGGGGAATRIVCGYLQSDDPIFDPALAVFPEAFVVHPDTAAATWVAASVEYVMTQAGDANSLTGLVPTRIPEFLVVEVLRLHLASAPWSDSRWLEALSDPVVGPAMAAMHADPGRKWTVAQLASESSVSRSLLDERFRDVVGQAPISYLAKWRMHVAADLLAGTELTVASVGRRVGYEAEEAFSRAFKKVYGASPGTWRQRG